MASAWPSSAVPESQPTTPAHSADMVALEAKYRSRLERERSARKQAEKLLEDRSLALYQANQALKASAEKLEQLVQERTQALQVALDDAKAATLAKSRFLATMSHEIRTPMNGILGLSEMLAHTLRSAEQTQFVDTIQRSGQSLLVLLNDILDFSKIEAGHLVLENQTLVLQEEITHIMGLLAQQAQVKGLDLQVVTDPDVPPRIQADAVRLRQVVLNLVGNAIKFTHRGYVRVHTQRSPIYPGGLRISVTDTGVGIPLDAQEKIFEPFVQADSSTTRQFGGTGLGLVISRRIVEIMGGQLWVQSEPQRGSTFGFDWPAVPADALAELMPQTQATPVCEPPTPIAVTSEVHLEVDNPARWAELKVLLAEDHPINRQLAVAQLKTLGIVGVDIAVDGQQALERVRHCRYDVVMMDMQMPRMDGLEATRQLRAMPLPTQPWVLAMTANAFDDDRKACLEAGMDDFVSKPANVATLRAAFTRFLQSG